MPPSKGNGMIPVGLRQTFDSKQAMIEKEAFFCKVFGSPLPNFKTRIFGDLKLYFEKKLSKACDQS